jgi:hypothetical protein
MRPRAPCFFALAVLRYNEPNIKAVRLDFDINPFAAYGKYPG